MLVLSALLVSFLPTGMVAVVKEKDGSVILYEPVKPGDVILVGFTHSVEKVPDIEYFEVGRDRKLLLTRTIYGSMGAGLPSDDTFNVTYDGNGYFLIDNINKTFDSISYMTGDIPKHYIIIHENKYPIYSLIPEGKQFILTIEQNYALKSLLSSI
ncbi:DUF1850 domain-containing protein [Methanooceanicella nereidis]|nr:DUF1850 domain-containing protein [Methanocella sp. CWC-04]